MINITKNKCDSKTFELIGKGNYIEYEIKGFKTIKSAKLIIEELKDYENASILLFRSIQLLGNALLIKNIGIRSKGKNCQFKELYEKNIISITETEDINFLIESRNNINYLNKNNDETQYELYIQKCNNFIEKIKEKLK